MDTHRAGMWTVLVLFCEPVDDSALRTDEQMNRGSE